MAASTDTLSRTDIEQRVREAFDNIAKAKNVATLSSKEMELMVLRTLFRE